MGDCACDIFESRFEFAPSLSFFFLELTPACNNTCQGCSNVFRRSRSLRPISAENWRLILAKLLPYRPHLKLTGGEPTLHPEFQNIVERIAELGMPFTLFTNARWKNPGRLLAFLRRIPQMDGMLVSLHGPDVYSHQSFTETSDSFDETVSNIRKATENGLKVVLSTVLTTANHFRVKEMLALGDELGVARVVFNRYIGSPMPGLTLDDLQLLLTVRSIEESLVKSKATVGYGTPIPQCFIPNHSNGCWAGRLHLAVDPWGNVHPCTHSDVVAGNLLEEDLETIRDAPALQAFQRLPISCSQCPMVLRCRGGCQVMSHRYGGSGDPLICRISVPRDQRKAEFLSSQD